MGYQAFPDLTKGVLTGAAGQPVLAIQADNDLNARLYLQLHDCSTGTLATDPATPEAGKMSNSTIVAVFTVPGDDARFWDLSRLAPSGWASKFGTGVAFVFSTTRDTITEASATDCRAQFWFGTG